MEIEASAMLACNIIRDQTMCDFLKEMDKVELTFLREEELKVAEKKFYKIEEGSSALSRLAVAVSIVISTACFYSYCGVKFKPALSMGGCLALLSDSGTKIFFSKNPQLPASLEYGEKRFRRIIEKIEAMKEIVQKNQENKEEIESNQNLNIEQIYKVYSTFLSVIENYKESKETANRLPEPTPEI